MYIAKDCATHNSPLTGNHFVLSVMYVSRIRLLTILKTVLQ